MAKMKDGCVKPARGPIAAEEAPAAGKMAPSEEVKQVPARVGKVWEVWEVWKP